MSIFTKTPSRGGLRRLALAGLSVLTFAPSALAGTFSVVGIDWIVPGVPPVPTGNAFMNLSSYDVNYGVTSTGIEGPLPPTSNGAAMSGAVADTVKWKVRWVGEPGETPPGETAVKIRYAGSAAVSVTGEASLADCSASVKISDTGFLANSAGTLMAKHTWVPYASSLVSDSQTAPYELISGTGTFSLVSGTTNTWEAPVILTIQMLYDGQAEGSYSAIGGGSYLYNSYADASVEENVKVRLTWVGSQRVQPDP